jgi:hypothetical protein
MLNVSSVFNSSGEVGSWITASNTNFTGDLTLSLMMIIGLLLLVAFMFKMPMLLGVLVIFPLVNIFSTLSVGFNIVLGTFILIVAFGLYSMWVIK